MTDREQTILVVAEIFATFEGHLESFNAEQANTIKSDNPQFEGRFVGYCQEAEAFIEALRERGYHLVRI